MPLNTPQLPFKIDGAIDPALLICREGDSLAVGVAIDAHVSVKRRSWGCARAARRERARPMGDRRGPLSGSRHALRGSGAGRLARLRQRWPRVPSVIVAASLWFSTTVASRSRVAVVSGAACWSAATNLRFPWPKPVGTADSRGIAAWCSADHSSPSSI
jgi:hypothetical protein